MNKLRLVPLACLIAAPVALHGSVIDISDEGEYESIIKKDMPTLVEFAASWCGVCNRIKPAFEEVAGDNEFNNVTFVRVDIEQAPAIRKKNGIVGVPSFIFAQGNTQRKESVGVKNIKSFKEDLRNDLRTVFKFPDPRPDEEEEDA